MLALVGFLVILSIIALLVTKKVSVHFALIFLPIIGALIMGFNFVQIGKFAQTGLSTISSTGIMLTFAVLFFGVLFDAGLFDPIIKFVIRVAGGDPVKIVIGTAVIAALVHLDGSGSITFLIVCSAMLPIYKALKMRPIVLGATAGLAAGVMNLVPWGGPTIRVATALKLDVVEVFRPMISWIIIGLVCVFIFAYFIGMKERKRLGIAKDFVYGAEETDPAVAALKRPKMFIINIILAVGSIVVLLTNKIPLPIVFIVATPLALMFNYPNIKDQQKRIMALSPTALYTASIIFSAGVLTGVLSGTGMIKAMAIAMSGAIPASLGGLLPALLGIVSIPLLMVIDVDSWYFGVLPVLAATGQTVGVEPIVMGRAMLIGQHIFSVMPLTGSSWLLASLTGVDMGDLQKIVLPVGFAIGIIFVISGLFLGII